MKRIELLFMVLLLPSMTAAIDLTPGEYYHFLSYNKSGILSCDPINTTFYCPLEISYADVNYSNLNLNLSCGEKITDKKENWNYSIQCGEPSNATDQICEYKKRIYPGEDDIDIEYQTAACDIEIDVEECPTVDCDDVVDAVTTQTEIEIGIDQDYIYLKVDDWDKKVAIDEYSNFTAAWTKSADCGFIRNQSNITECGWQECNQFCVHGDYIEETFTTWTNAMVELSGNGNECESRLFTLQGNENECQRYLDIARQERDDWRNKTGQLELYIKGQDRDIKDLRTSNIIRGWGMGVSIVLLIIAVGIILTMVILQYRS